MGQSHLLHALLFVTVIEAAYGIGCYVCSSKNGSDQRCEDEFNAYPEAYEESCQSARNDRMGVFPATWCIKFKAYTENSTIVVRNCALDNGGTTKDVEIGTLDHCGWVRDIKFNNEPMKGCLMTCQSDGCNGTDKTSVTILTIAVNTVMFLAVSSYAV